jgi:hypothetical protein
MLIMHPQLKSPNNFEIGQGRCTPAQISNIQIANASYALHAALMNLAQKDERLAKIFNGISASIRLDFMMGIAAYAYVAMRLV